MAKSTAAKKVQDQGLVHIKKLGLSSKKDPKGIYTELSEKLGESATKDILDKIYDAYEKQGLDAYYRVKNSDYDTAMIFSGGYDADIIRKACKWVADNAALFGDTILEVGCDCGFMTTFLASFFPRKHIVVIDRCPECIEIAKTNVEKFGLNNVVFNCTALEAMKGYSFDTVFAMRALQENLKDYVPENPADEITAQAKVFGKAIAGYIKSLATLVKDGGNLICIETLGRDAQLLSLISVISAKKFMCDTAAYEELKCKMLGDDITLQALVFEKVEDGVDAFDTFMKCCAKYMDLQGASYESWNAKIMYEFTAGELIDAYKITAKESGEVNKIVLCKHKRDDSCLVIYQNNNGYAKISYLDISALEDVAESIKNTVAALKKDDSVKVAKIKKV